MSSPETRKNSIEAANPPAESEVNRGEAQELSAEQLAQQAQQERSEETALKNLSEVASVKDHAVAEGMKTELKSQIDAGGEINITNMKNVDAGPSPEEQRALWETEQLAQFLKDHPEMVAIPAELRESGPEIAQFEAMLVAFEAEHSIEELNAIIDLTLEESLTHPVRKPAQLALGPINTKLNALKKETNISSESYEELRAKYKRLSRAIGIIKNDKVDHTR